MTNRQKFGLKVVQALGQAQVLVYRYVIRDVVWRSFDGTVWLVSEMTDRHLQNAIAMLRRQSRPDTAIFRELVAELAKRAKPTFTVREK